MKSPILPVILLMSLVCTASHLHADEGADDEEVVRKSTAVALNYCSAALHRIRRLPSKGVYHQEQTRILNNLDLNQIRDPEVIALYKSILDEIAQVEISERERLVINEQFRRNVHRQLGTSFFVLGAQMATGQLGSVIQSGANSWWDYRSTEVRRDTDKWKVEKKDYMSLHARSGKFLDSFWRLAQKNKIPDRWLIRDQNLDDLRNSLADRDAEVRLRKLKRLRRDMICYPPYWYYLARTQQELGQAEEALKTYEHLSEIGDGHFRQDDMLASSMANMALLQESMGHPDAARTASRVLNYSIRSWEANLVSAWVLGRHEKYDEAEEMILCNLDEDQEASQSRVSLVSLYYHSKNTAKLAALLEDKRVVADVPIPGLLLCARSLGERKMPAKAQAYLASTLSATGRRVGRGNTITLAAAPGWKIQDAQPQVVAGNRSFQSRGYRPGRRGVDADFSIDEPTDGNIRVSLNYPQTPAIHVTLTPRPRPVPAPRSPFPGTPRKQDLPQFLRGDVQYQIGEIELDGLRLSFQDAPPVKDVRVEDSSKEVLLEESATRS